MNQITKDDIVQLESDSSEMTVTGVDVICDLKLKALCSK